MKSRRSFTLLVRHIGLYVALAFWANGAAAQQAVDDTYTQMIREFTTETFFSTPHVNYLPASETVPTPLDILGHIAGAADVLTYPEEIYRYMRAVADASPRVSIFTIGQTEEGRDMILVAVSDEATIANLEHYKELNGRLADPRGITPEEAEGLIQEAKPMYWATGAIHSPETGSPEMLMELVYRLAVDESEFIRTIRDNVIVMVTPVIEVDGRAKQVDLHMAKRIDSTAVVPRRLLYWGKYVAHDNNRDGISGSLRLTQNVTRTFLEFHPQIFHDLHESASHLYTSTGRGPYNSWIDPITINEWNNLAYKEVKDMTAFGVPGVYTHDFYDGWAPNYMFSVAQSHNAIGRFYETQGAGDASNRIITTNIERQWHRPNTPLPETVWSIRNNVNLQQSAILIAMNYVAENSTEFMQNYYQKSVRSIAKATTEGPAAYVFPARDPRPELQARLLRLFQSRGLEVHRADRDFEVGEDSFGAGSYIVRMDQPYSRHADMLLDKQYYNPNDPSPYDDVGWTLGPSYNIETVRIEDPEILSAGMTLVPDSITVTGAVEHLDRNVGAYLINYEAENRLTEFRYANPDLPIEAAEESFEARDHQFNAGTFIIHAEEHGPDFRNTVEQWAQEYGFTAYGVADRRFEDVVTHEVAAPRVAVVHTWQNTQSEGWLRVGLDQYGVPYEYISVHEIRDDANLNDKYDVILMGPSSLNALSVLQGVTGDQAIPWQRTEITPNLGANDETDDMRGGLEIQGILHLKQFVENGGTFLTISSSSSIPIHFGIVNGVSIKSTPTLWARGGVFRVNLSQETSPLAYGFDDHMGVYFNTAPVFSTQQTGGRRFGGATTGGRNAGPANTTGRRTGRGGVGDQDIVQGRPRDMGQAGVEAFRESGGEDAPNSFQQAQATNRNRTIFSFAPVDDLLISGGLQNGGQLAGAPAMVDAPVGEGHVVLFSFNPFWRGQTVGSYALVFNALLHHGNLDAGEDAEDEPSN